MKRVIDIVRTFVISPEFLFVAIISLLVYIKPTIFAKLASMVNTADEPIKFLALVPISITVYLMSKKDELLFPEQHSSYKILQSWPDYQMLLDRYWIAITWGIICSLPCLAIWIFSGDLTNYIIFSLFFCSIITSVITALTFFGATITLRRILSATITEKR
jgi:hypothetical protein